MNNITLFTLQYLDNVMLFIYKYRKRPFSLASSTSIISLSNGRGDLLMVLHMVRMRVDHASLWNTITTLVVGSRSGYCLFLHLQQNISLEHNISDIVNHRRVHLQEIILSQVECNKLNRYNVDV